MSEYDNRLDELMEMYPHHIQRINELKSQNIDSETIINIIHDELVGRLYEIRASLQDDIDDGLTSDDSFDSCSSYDSSFDL